MSTSERHTKEGELMKYRNVLHGWKKYYFKLERSYLHYFEGKYNSEPKGTITRGEISRLEFIKPLDSNQFKLYTNSGITWHLRAASHEERMEWMKTLLPDAYIVDPFKAVPDSSSAASEQSQQTVLPEQLPGSQCTLAHPIYPQINLPVHLPTASNTTLRGSVPDSPPPAYDDINYT